MHVYVLLGNFGNKLDKFVPATSSTTQPTNPVYDGCKYHYLPWLDTKPCVTVDCDWEDNSYRWVWNLLRLWQMLIWYPLYHRIESLNILLHMTEQLADGIKQVSDIIRMEDYDLTEAGARLLVTIEQLIENLEYVV